MSLRLAAAALACTGLLALGAAPLHAGEPIDGEFSASGLSGSYRLIPPDGPLGPGSVGLLLFFHADGGAGAFHEQADALVRRGEKSRLAVAALTVPTEGGGLPTDPADRCWWAPRAQRNAEYVGAWIDEVAAAELGDAIDFDRVYFAGVSGGADFAAELNLHLGFRFGGGAVALCGGDMPRADGGSCVGDLEPPLVEPLPGPADVPPGAADGFVYSFDLTADDVLLPLAQQARSYYEGLGFRVLFATPAGSGHCNFKEPLEELLDRRIERVASFTPPGGCTLLDLSEPIAALADDVPLEVAEQAIPEDDPARSELLAKIQQELDAVTSLRATIPDGGAICPARSGCTVVKLKKAKRQIRRHLNRLKGRLVPKALKHNDDRVLRKELKQVNRQSHRAKKAALKEIPGKLRLCED